MAPRAVAAGLETQAAVGYVHRERIDVALQTLEALLAPREQHLIHASVRGVAGQAPLHLDRRVLEHERPPLLDMALGAGLPARLPHRGAVGGSVRIVAVRCTSSIPRAHDGESGARIAPECCRDSQSKGRAAAS